METFVAAAISLIISTALSSKGRRIPFIFPLPFYVLPYFLRK